ncbi:MAG: tRNA (adenosine(37)-N6)-dimethylallyltransferase MiaA [Ignavibacteria bacterium]|nr:tRNA (adenosine(37)-N6)-dimethylallyltransferase MiaA [Ignavibacteria bacterium]
MSKTTKARPKSHILIQEKKVLVLVGPTASGKTLMSEKIADFLPIEIISADSRQIYKHLDIGTAKPPKELLQKIKHHFVDELEPNEGFNAAEFSKRGRKIIEEIFSRKKIPLVLCGTGLYLRALLDGIFEGPSADYEIREKFFKRYQNEGGEKLLNELRAIDADAAKKMLPTNKLRIVRALEVFELTGKPISQLQQEETSAGNFLPIIFGLEWNRKILYDSINKRVEEMLSNDFLDEVEKIQAMGFSSKLNSLQTVGYKEAGAYLRNEISFERMKELVKQNTRRYAKRQLTWFRSDSRIQWIYPRTTEDLSALAKTIVEQFIRH